ncbi:MAG: sigma-70 family RNA polymerase sigma factor [Pseudomonadota bacterium]
MQPVTEDWDLLARAPGDDAALGQLFQRHRDYVFRIAWGLLNERALADDVVQEVFLKMRSGRLRAKPRARFTTWLYKVAINTAREQARSRRKMWGDPAAIKALEAVADPATDPTRQDTLNDLGQSLAVLPIRQREVVVMRLLEGFDTAETAEILGCRQGTVKAHLHRATATLKSHLDNRQPKEKTDEKADDRGADDRNSKLRSTSLCR